MLDNLYKNIGIKIKNWAKWIFIAEAIGAIIAGISMIGNSFDNDTISFILGIVIIISGIFVAWISTWLLYAFGQLVEDTHELRLQNSKISNIDKNIQNIVQPIANKANEKAKCDVETKAECERGKWRNKIEEENSKDEKTLQEKLAYAILFQSDEGMINYLKNIQDETIQNVLKLPKHLIREEIKKILSNM